MFWLVRRAGHGHAERSQPRRANRDEQRRQRLAARRQISETRLDEISAGQSGLLVSHIGIIWASTHRSAVEGTSSRAEWSAATRVSTKPCRKERAYGGDGFERQLP